MNVVDAARPEEPILVVDDEPGILRIITKSLKLVGYEVVQAETAEAGLQVLQQQPALMCAITDLRMPGIGGHGFVRKAQVLAPDLPIIVMSGHGDMDDVIECIRQGVSDYVRKPWGDGDLRAAVERTRKRRERLRAELAGDAALALQQSPRPPGFTPRPPSLTPRPSPLAVSAVVPTPRPPTGNTGPLAAILARLRSGEVPIPALPSVVLAAREVAQNERASAMRMKEVVEQDSYLAARIIRVANSSYHLGYGRVTDLRAAIARVGVRELASLIDTLILQQFHAVPDARFQPLVETSWRRTLHRAVTMRFLAQELRTLGVMPDDAYLAGLFCDIGVPFLFRVLAEFRASPSDAATFVSDHHAQMGGTILDTWQLPSGCAEVARRHHSATLPGPTLVRLLWAAEPIITACGVPEDSPPHPRALETQLELGFTPAMLESVQARVQAYVATHASAMGPTGNDATPAS